jgi:hypothetical protein
MEVLGLETLIYDLLTHKAHCLNQTAALIWSLCDGQSTVAEIVAKLETEFDPAISEQIVWLALQQLDDVNLLSGGLPTVGQTITRRAVMRTIGLGAVTALPLVISNLAPTTAEAASCVPKGEACTPSSICCKGTCIPALSICS